MVIRNINCVNCLFCRRGGPEDHSEDAQAFVCRETKAEQGFEEIVMDSHGVIFSCEKRNKFLNFVDMVQIGFYVTKGSISILVVNMGRRVDEKKTYQ